MSKTDPTPEVFTAEYLELSFAIRTAVANFHLLGSNNEEERIRWMDSALNTLHAAYTLGKTDMDDPTPEVSAKWQRATEQQAPPHKRYIVRHPEVGEFEATPCYGMHAPFWVSRVEDRFRHGSYCHIPLEDTEWREKPSDPESEIHAEYALGKKDGQERMRERIAIDLYKLGFETAAESIRDLKLEG